MLKDTSSKENKMRDDWERAKLLILGKGVSRESIEFSEKRVAERTPLVGSKSTNKPFSDTESWRLGLVLRRDETALRLVPETTRYLESVARRIWLSDFWLSLMRGDRKRIGFSCSLETMICGSSEKSCTSMISMIVPLFLSLAVKNPF